MSIDLSPFTDSQRQAILHDSGNLQLIACAGAGKTEVLACRVAMLIDRGTDTGLRPGGIVSFTFQEKAAGELKQRIASRVAEQVGEAHGLAEMYVGTIHGFCLDFLKEHAPEYLKYEVLDEVQQRLLVDRNSRKSGLTTTADLKGAKLRRFVDTNNYTAALDILRESTIDGEALEGSSVVEGLRAYEELLDAHALLDYPAMMVKAVELLEGDQAVREAVAGRFRHVIVDEYQDVNPVQERLIRTLHELGASLCVIGDDDQTIHQWRGSDVHNILTFADRYEDVEQIRLDDNFRSTEGVVKTAREFVEQNPDRLPKKMEAASRLEFEQGDVCALSFQSPEEEAAWIVEQIRQLRGVAFAEADGDRGLTYSDMAVLLRSVRRNAEPITDALRAAGIPFVVSGMNNLFGTAEARAARELFYFVAGPGRTRPESTLDDVRTAWLEADLGLDTARLEEALETAARAKEELGNSQEKRWGVYSIQRVYLSFIEDCQLREETVPEGRGEIVLYNLGKFSQLISDFEEIHFHSKPVDKYFSFAGFLEYQAEDAYDEGWLDHQHANPDAVRVMTVHQAKGMQWPVVFVPALLRNRFPAAKMSGRTVWHVLPREAVDGQERYENSIEDERRLFYVAMTRSQKFLFMTWGRVEGYRNRYAKPSEFWSNVLASKFVKRRPPDFSGRPRIEPRQRAGVSDVVLSFSDLRYFFECPYQFKLRILYGFNRPIPEALGYGKSLHDALAEIHARAMRGDLPGDGEVAGLVERHLRVPFAYPELKETLTKSAQRVLHQYLAENAELFPLLEYAEKKIELSLSDGVNVVGRIDLVRRTDLDETSIVDFKSNERSQDENLTEMQLHLYVLGHEALTGATADFVEIYELDDGRRIPRAVDEEFIDDVKLRVVDAAQALRAGDLPAQPTRVTCESCDYCRLCSAGTAALAV
jgi:DNA helicase-2/ATP-dependent DNA helicase PcrA